MTDLNMESKTEIDPAEKLTKAEGDKIKNREQWKHKIDFLFACVAFSVGLGNVWRFPYLCYKNGGGAFLIPYFICVVLGGIPMFFLEVSIGQFMSACGITVWNICPLFQGIGIATTIIVFLVNIYYNVIIAWAIYYLFASFTRKLPWTTCGNDWNTERCFSQNSTSNSTILATNTSTDPATEYWERHVLRISGGLDDMGEIRWDLCLCLLLAWIIVYVCICRGIKSSGKVMYFTAPAPYVLMTILLIRGVTLPGAWEGIRYYLVPVWHKLLDPQVWTDAGTQIFYSYSIGIGALTAIGSFNKFHHNCFRDCIIFAVINSGTSIFAGFVIFSVLGYMAYERGVPVSEVAESGPGLAFVAYPKAVAQMPVAPLWSALFFIMIILLGLDCQFFQVEGLAAAIVDRIPHVLRRGRREIIFIGAVCLVSFLIGLSMVTNGGMYLFQLVDYYSISRMILLIGFFECIVITWIYGGNRFLDNLKMMLGYRVSVVFKGFWMVVTPLFTLITFVLCFYDYKELTYNRIYHYPLWAITVGWVLGLSSVIMIPIWALVLICRTPGSLSQRWFMLIRPRLRPHQLREKDDVRDLIDGPTAIQNGLCTEHLMNTHQEPPLKEYTAETNNI